ncbi:MAG: dihydropteroate synthase [Acidimicrobiales bacterium]
MRPLVLGILNVTPDSFSDGGQFSSVERAVERALEMLGEGADIIDIGGESTRPGADAVSIDTELERVIPVIEALRARRPDARISIDTRRVEVARPAVSAGAEIINDVSASLHDVAAETGAGWIAMHMQGQPADMQHRPHYANVVAEVREFLVERAEAGRRAGVANIWIDPGFGFGKSEAHNMALLAGLASLVDTGWPVAVGLSRKSMLGAILARSDGADVPVPAGDRLEGSVATATYAMLLGASMIRVHDVKAAWQAATVVAADPKWKGPDGEG